MLSLYLNRTAVELITGGGREDNPGGRPTFPAADSAGHQVQDPDWKATAKDVLVLAWTGVELLLKKVQPFLDGTPAKAPVAAVNALIEIKNVCCQLQCAIPILNVCIRRLETTKEPSNNLSFKLLTDCSPWMKLWIRMFPTPNSHG